MQAIQTRYNTNMRFIKENWGEILMGALTILIIVSAYFIITIYGTSSGWLILLILPSIIVMSWWYGYFFLYDKNIPAAYQCGYWDKSKNHKYLEDTQINHYYKFLNDLINFMDKADFTTEKCKKKMANKYFSKGNNIILHIQLFTVEGNRFMEKYYIGLLSKIMRENISLEDAFFSVVLPNFKYHPYPIESGSVKQEDIICSVCNEERNFTYTGPIFCTEEVEDICPWCIKDGKAAKKYKAEFQDIDSCEKVNKKSYIDELIHRTPGYEALQQARWLSHCNDFCAYICSTEEGNKRTYHFKCLHCDKEKTTHDFD